MAFPYKRVLLIGATAGIGAAMADRLVDSGVKVIAVGRRQERLDAFVQKHGSEKATAIRFDITDGAGIDAFVKGVVDNYPDLDCVFINAGIQSPVRLNQPAQVDLDAFHNEINTNFTSVVNISIKFLTHLLSKDHQSSIIYTGTHLSLIPAVTLPAYSASKAAAGAYFECLRRQNQGSHVKFIEIAPPVVQTELHDYAGERGRSMGIPVNDFVDQAFDGLVKGDEVITVGHVVAVDASTYHNFVAARKSIFDKLSNLLMAHF